MKICEETLKISSFKFLPILDLAGVVQMENWPQIWIPHIKKPIYQLLDHENLWRDTENIII